MASERFQVKLYAQNPAAVELDKFVPVFHRWIRDSVFDELLIDVADYTHVHEGPGVVLVGHGSDYFLDLGEGRPGLLYSRKRDFPAGNGHSSGNGKSAGRARMADAFRRAIRAARLLEEDPAAGGVKFSTNEILVRIPDRLNAPNTDATLEALRPELEALLGALLGGETFELTREGDERRAFTVRVRAQGAPDLATLASQLS